MIRVPTIEKTILQTGRSNVLGNVWSTKNIDLQTNLGRIRTANRLGVGTNSDSQVNLGRPIGFRAFNDKMYTIAGSRVFEGSISGNSAYSENIGTGVATDYDDLTADLEIFKNELVTTRPTKIYSLDTSNAWTDRGTINTGLNHKLLFFQKFNRLYVSDLGDRIKSLDTSWVLATSGDYFIKLAYKIITMVATTNRIWIGVQNTDSTAARGAVLEWDGISSQIIKEHKLNANECKAMIVIDDVPYAMDSSGILSAYNGANFREVGRLPFPEKLPWLEASGNADFIHPNGLAATKNGTILALIDNKNNDGAAADTTINENCPSGIWEWSSGFGFVHRYSFSYASSLIGAPRVVSDYGQNRISLVGGLYIKDIAHTGGNRLGIILAGAKYFTNASTEKFGIFNDDLEASQTPTWAGYSKLQNASYFVTTWFDSQNVQDQWQKIFVKFKKFINTANKIILKYRTVEATAAYFNLTWSSTTVFTTTTNVAGKEGQEVEILQGTGSGLCAHITTISESGGTYTVTLDETVTGATGTARGRVQDWKKIGSITESDIESKELSLGVSSPRIQIKCFWLGQDEDEIHEVIITNTPSQLIQ